MVDRIKVLDLKAPDGSAFARIDLQILSGDHMLPTRVNLLYSGSTRNENKSESWKNRTFLVGTNPGSEVRSEEIYGLIRLLRKQFSQWVTHDKFDMVQEGVIILVEDLLTLKESATSYVLLKR